MEIPVADPTKLLTAWMEWETGESTPGRVMANLKTGGMRELLDHLVAEQAAASEAAGESVVLTGDPVGDDT